MKQKGTWEKSNYSIERESILMGLIEQHTPKIILKRVTL